MSLPASIELLLTRRSGGRVNLRGIDYQLRYSILKALQVLNADFQSTQVRLEGIEDVDVLHKLYVGSQQFYQLKHTTDRLTAAHLWEMGVLQNFIEVYLLTPKTEFYLVTNQSFTDKKLQALIQQPLTASARQYWEGKLDAFKVTSRAVTWNWTNFDIEAFLYKIQVIIITEERLILESTRIIVDRFAITNQTEKLYMHALFFHFFRTARQGGVIDYKDLSQLIGQVHDDLAKGPVNPAIQYRWIEPISFQVNGQKDYQSYFDGQPARPSHIALDLPVPRLVTEGRILKHLQSHDCAVICASSGQGKSTLAWRTSRQLNQQQNFHIYQLHSCQDLNAVGAVVEFISSRINLGYTPLIVIDGLSADCSSWVELAYRLADEPIQFLITTRQEDWARYGLDAYRVKTGELLYLSFTSEEAEQIYQELRLRGKLYSLERPWQSAWESVRERSLLIEYIYLLTKGELLADRLQAQIHRLNSEVDGGIKLRMLRLIATAHEIGLPIRSSRLIRYLKSFQLLSDQGRLLVQLEAEYYVRFDEQFVTGLHPVRSNHLYLLLHHSFNIADTLLELISLLDDSDTFQLGAAIPARLLEDDKTEFYEDLAKLISVKPATQISQLLYGIYQGEILRYQKIHQTIYDRTFKEGGYMLLPLLTVPFPHANSNYRQFLSETLEGKADHLVKAIDELPSFPIKQTDLHILIPLIHKYFLLSERSIEESGLLLRWFELFSLSVIMLSDEQLLNCLKTVERGLGRDLADALFTAHPEEFRLFVSRQQSKIISLLKVITNTLTLSIDTQRIKIEYILLLERVNAAVEESMHRIETIRSWLPIFELYESDAIMLPFPNELITKLPRINAHKTLSPDVITSPFTLKLNQVWNDALNRRYMADSFYTWQRQWIDLRQHGLECVRGAEQLLEQSLMHKRSSQLYKVNLNKFINAGKAFLRIDRTLLSFPEADRLSTHSNHFQSELEKLKEWASCLSAFINQFTALVLNDDPDTKRLALLNLSRAVYHLAAMQQSFTRILTATYTYNDPSNLEIEETRWYSRLYQTALFYGQHATETLFGRIENVQSVASKYWHYSQSNRLQRLYLTLDRFAEYTGYTVYKPKQLIDEEWNVRAVFGIDGVNLDEWEANSTFMLRSLALLALLDIPFYTVILCREGTAIFAFRIHKTLLDHVLAEIEGEELPDFEADLPYEVLLTDEEINYLPGIIINKPSAQTQETIQLIYNLYDYLWQLTECRNRLLIDDPIEKEWRQENIKNLAEHSNNSLAILKSTLRLDLFYSTQQIADKVLTDGAQWTPQELADLLRQSLRDLTLA